MACYVEPNTVLTIDGYIAEGFTAKEAFLAQRHDILFNQILRGSTNPKKKAEMYLIVERLGL